MPPVLLSETGSAAMAVLAVLAMAAILPGVVDPRRIWHRAALMGVTILLGCRYMWWRGTETLPPPGLDVGFVSGLLLYTLELGAFLSSVSAGILMTRFRDRSPEAEAGRDWWAPGPPPRVAIFVATYNESREVLERTIVGAAALDYPDFEVMVLDDGRREWLRHYCAERGVTYVTRPDGHGAKAGNINHALRRLAAQGRAPDFFAVLDADFVPHRNFLTRTLAVFADPEVGLVQTPQHFFNADPIQNNLGLARSYPDEQRFFFDHMQPSRDGWGIAICCGTSSVARWTAVEDVGFLPTDSVTEDFLLSLTLQEAGWRTAYLNEALTEGLAPEGLKEYITQRARWCLGLMQIARGRLGPLGQNRLRLRDRWSVADSVLYWIMTFPFRIAALIFPLLYWYFNVIVVVAPLPQVLGHFGVYFAWSILAYNLLSPGMVVPVLKDVTQYLGAFQISRAAITGILKPHGHPFSVTAKGGDRSKVVIQWWVMAPFAVLLALNVVGLGLGIFSDRFAYHDAGEGKAVILFWTIYNVIVLSLTVLACIELPRREEHVADAPERVIFAPEGAAPARVWLASLALDTARIRGRPFAGGVRGILRIPGLGDMEATVMETLPDGARLHLVVEEQPVRMALLRRLYAEGPAPGTGRVRLAGLIADLGTRFSRERDT